MVENNKDIVQEIGFDDESVEVIEVENYKGKKGYRDRVGFPLVGKGKDGKMVPFTMKARVHYDDRTGTFLCLSSAEQPGACCKALGDPGLRFGTIVIVYHTEKNGKLKQPGGYDLKLWFFSDKKFDKLRQVNREYNLAEVDMYIDCENEEYQHLSFIPCKESVLIKAEKLKEKVIAQCEKLKGDLKKRLARQKSNDQIREELGIEGSSPSPVDESDIGDYSDVLKEIE